MPSKRVTAICGCLCSSSWPRNARGFRVKSPSMVPALKRGGGRAELTRAQLEPPVGISGTWDFKWRQGAAIHVTFQSLSEQTRAELASAMGRALPAMERWESSLREAVAAQARLWTQKTSVQLIFNDTPLPAPLRNGKSPSGHERRERHYDVLVSLEPLPVEEPHTPTDPAKTIAAPTSQLGSYALRADYGVPSVYLGRQQGDTTPLHEYFFSDPFNAVVTHEFGHVLGLAHEHQNPSRKPNWRPIHEIRGIIQAHWQLPGGHQLLSDEYIVSEIIEPWPGNPAFSDWRPAEKLDSVMAHPLYEAFLQGPGSLTPDQAAARVRTAPTQDDLEQINLMYPLRPTVPRSSYLRELRPDLWYPKAPDSASG